MEVMMVGGGVGATLRSRVLPVPLCLALSALLSAAVPDLHGVMAAQLPGAWTGSSLQQQNSLPRLFSISPP